jgi:outer membrane protein, heavy metal efflux system
MLRVGGTSRKLWASLAPAVLSSVVTAQEMGGQGNVPRSGMSSGGMSHSMPGSSQPGISTGGMNHAMPGMSMPSQATLTPSVSAPRTPQATAPSNTAAPPPGGFASMGLADFERIAMQHNPTLKQAAAQFEAALSRSFQAGLYPNPTIGYVQDQIGSFSESKPTASGFAVQGKPSPGDNVGGFVQWQIVTAGKLRLSRAKFAEEANAARWQAIYQELRVINGVRIQFFEVLAAQRMIDIHREILRLDEESVRTMQEMVNIGQANEPELLQARVRERRERVALRNAENRYRGDWEELVSLVGTPELRPVPMDPRPLETEVAPVVDFDGTLAHLLHNSPEIQAALSEIRRDQIMVRRERAEPIPNILVQAVTGYNYEFGVQTAGVQVGIPLPLTNRNQGTVREAMSDLSRDRAEYDRVALSLRQRLADAYTRYQNALGSVDDFRAGSLPMARRAYEMQLMSYQRRRTAWPHVLEARRMYFDLSQEYVESLLELRRAEVEIGGMLAVDGLSSPASPTSQGHIEAVPTPR